MTSKAELTAACLCPQSVSELKPQVDELTRSSNAIYNYVSSVSSSLRERQRVISGPQERRPRLSSLWAGL